MFPGFSLLLAPIKWLFDNSKILLALGIFVAGAGAGWWWEHSNVLELEARIEETTRKAEQAEQEIREESKLMADVLAEEYAELDASLSTTVSDYEARLQVMRANPKVKIVEVPVPDSNLTAQVTFENGTLVCANRPSAYKTSVDEVIRKAEEALK